MRCRLIFSLDLELKFHNSWSLTWRREWNIYIFRTRKLDGNWKVMMEGRKNYRNFIEKNILLLKQRHGKYSHDIIKSYIELFAAFHGKVACFPINLSDWARITPRKFVLKNKHWFEAMMIKEDRRIFENRIIFLQNRLNLFSI